MTGTAVIMFWGFLMLCCVGDNENKAERYRVTAILPAKSNGIYWKEVVAGIEEAADDIDVDLSIIYTEAYNNYPAIDLNSALEMTILYQADAVIVSYSRNANERTDELLREAKEKGIKIVMIDNDVSEELKNTCVSIDNVKAGSELARLALEDTDKSGTALLIYSVENMRMSNMELRMEGIEQMFEEEGKKNLILLPMEEQSDVRKVELLRKTLEQNPKTDVIFTLSEGSTKNVVQCLSQVEFADQIEVFGFDYTDETADLLEKGKVSVLVGQEQKQMGYESLNTAVKLQNEECEQVFIDYQIYSNLMGENEGN